MTVLPTSVVVHRDEPKRDKRWSPQFSRRLPVRIRMEGSPPPVPYTSFYGVGKDPAHAWPHRVLFQSLAIADRLAVMAPNFLVKKVPSALVVEQPRGIAIPVSQRANIAQPGTTTLGSLSAVAPQQVWAPQYAKITH